MERFLAIIDGISDWAGKLFAFVVLAATLGIVVEVIMRYVFNAPPVWGLELSVYLCGITYLMGGAYAELARAHVRVDIIYERWSPRVRAIIDLVTKPFFFFGVATLFWLGLEWTISAFVKGTTSGTPWSPPVWPIRSFIVLGSLLLLLQGIATLVRDWKTAWTGRETTAGRIETL